MKLFFLILFSVSAFAGPSSSDCNYYREVESTYKCGPKGYPLDFGFRLCEKYLKAQPNTRPNVKTWFPKVRFCLQDFIAKNHGSFRDCDDLKTRALDSHLNCYKDTGFCGLSLVDESQILRITAFDIFRPSIMSLSLRVQSVCNK